MKNNRLINNKEKYALLISEFLGTLILGLMSSFIANSLLRLSLNEWAIKSYITYLIEDQTVLMWMEIGLLFLIYLWIKSILKSKWGTTILFLTISMSLSVANYQKMNIRSEPVYPSDFDMIKVLPELMKMLDIKMVVLSISFVSILLVLTVYFVRRHWLLNKKNGPLATILPI